MTHLLNAGPTDSYEICIMTRGEVLFANTQGAMRGFDVIPAGTFWDAGKLLADVAASFGDRPEGLLLVPALPGGGEEYDSTSSLATRWAGTEAAALRTDWMVTGDTERIRDTGWVTFRHLHTNRKIYMGVLSQMDQSRTPLFDLTASAETIANRLISYASVTGVLWRMTPGVSGCASIRDDRAARAQRQLTLPELDTDPDQGQPHWRWDKAPAELHGAGHMIWSRPLAAGERHGKIVTYDVRAQFLAAMASARLGWGEPARKDRPVFDVERAGFWLIPASPLLAPFDGLYGPPIVKHIDSRGLTWVTTPVMVYLAEHGIQPLIYDSWTSATSSELLRPWAHKLRNAIYAQSETLREIEPALKRTYSDTNGMFNSPGGSIYRKDWHWTDVDLATMNVRRKLWRVKRSIGIWPCQIYHDAVSYPVDDPEAFAQLNSALGVIHPSGPRINVGTFKYVRTEDVYAWEAKQDQKKARRANG